MVEEVEEVVYVYSEEERLAMYTMKARGWYLY